MAPQDLSVRGRVDGYQVAPAFTHVSTDRYASEIADDISIDVWISTEAAAAYLAIDPDLDGSRVELPDGTVIVREVHDLASGELRKLTVMVKGPLGIVPELGDWWFAVTDANGAPLVDDSGAELAGAMPECQSCHLGRKDDGYLFGVPAPVRLPVSDLREGI
jgi:hypothetical protein